ncbi:hypothetical protein [Ferruginibacter sp.]
MTEIKTAYNTGLAKVAVPVLLVTFVVNQKVWFLHINFCGKKRHLHKPKTLAVSVTELDDKEQTKI